MKFSTNLIALALLAAMYLVSIIHFVSLYAYQSSSVDGEERKIVRLAHWQLEPGYREGLQWAMDEYNKLPHVKKANVKVEQQGVTEKVYTQFLNVHLIAGTAPDIAVKGKSELIKGNAVARFFNPLSAFVNDPNPYNRGEYLPKGLDPELQKLLEESSWKDTFIDGMIGGYDQTLQDYYAIPASTWGGMRLFYNLKLVREAKDFTLAALEKSPQPEWLQLALITPDAGGPGDFVSDTPRLRKWLEGDQVPQTLGQLLLICQAITEVAKEPGREGLVAISGSSYGPNNAGRQLYADLMLTGFTEELDYNRDTAISGFESLVGWQKGEWDFDIPALREAYNLMRTFARFYPPGFLGLDREQAQRRFVLGNAMLIATGGWDAAGILRAVAKRSEDGRFDITISQPPMPVEGEKWSEFLTLNKSEAEFSTGVPLAINKQSKNPDWALDFLHFLTSYSVNQGMNQRAGWVPVVVGAEPIPEMMPFMPNPEGLPASDSLRIINSTGVIPQIRNVIEGNSKLVFTGEITYDEYVDLVRKAIADERFGIGRQWFDSWQHADDRTLAQDQSLNVEAVRQYLLDDEGSAMRRKARLYDTVKNDEGFYFRTLWKQLFPDQPFPTK